MPLSRKDPPIKVLPILNVFEIPLNIFVTTYSSIYQLELYGEIREIPTNPPTPLSDLFGKSFNASILPRL